MRLTALRDALDTLALGARIAAEVAALASRPFEPRPLPAPRSATTRDGRWRQDVEYLARELPRLHANLSHTLPRDAFDARVADLLRDIPSLEDHVVRARLAALVAAIGDAHTSLEGWDRSPSTFPFVASELSDGAFVTRAAPGWEHLLGCRLRRVGGLAVEEVRARAASLIAHENDARVSLLAPRYYSHTDVLHALGIIPFRAALPLDLRTAHGAERSVVVPAIDADVAERDGWARLPDPLPLYRTRAHEPFWFEVIGAGKVLYLKYNQCRHIRRFGRFARGVLRRLDEGGIERMAIDFRGNGGGNSLQFDYLLLRALVRRRIALIGLIDRATFSSAMLNAVQLHEHAGALLVGEATGGKPNSYGEVRRLRLPNSGLAVTYATRFITSAPDLGDAPSLEPDVRISASASEWLTGRDPVLDSIFSS